MNKTGHDLTFIEASLDIFLLLVCVIGGIFSSECVINLINKISYYCLVSTFFVKRVHHPGERIRGCIACSNDDSDHSVYDCLFWERVALIVSGFHEQLQEILLFVPVPFLFTSVEDFICVGSNQLSEIFHFLARSSELLLDLPERIVKTRRTNFRGFVQSHREGNRLAIVIDRVKALPKSDTCQRKTMLL